jgi:hypothetical protein
VEGGDWEDAWWGHRLGDEKVERRLLVEQKTLVGWKGVLVVELQGSEPLGCGG